VEIASDHLDFSLLDTLRLTTPVREALAAGRPTAVYYEIDAVGLPPGEFRLGIAPLDTAGRGLLTGFDVVWSLQLLARSTDDLLGEGRLVLFGDRLDAFLVAPRVEQERMLDEFWQELDPTPEDPYNEAYAEFRRRAAHVTAFYGGFDEYGARDPRGRIYMLLGEPSSIHAESMPMNEEDLNDARIMVYERYAPERPGSTAKDGAQGTLYYNVFTRSYQGAGYIPLPYSYLADKNIKAKVTSPDTRRFELWRYDDGGDQLFLNSYTGQGQGLRFLFVDKTGRGDYVLDSDNTRLTGD
jgi:GWxTD domain-containing protein